MRYVQYWSTLCMKLSEVKERSSLFPSLQRFSIHYTMMFVFILSYNNDCRMWHIKMSGIIEICKNQGVAGPEYLLIFGPHSQPQK
jgi:hypothetical protein